MACGILMCFAMYMITCEPSQTAVLWLLLRMQLSRGSWRTPNFPQITSSYYGFANVVNRLDLPDGGGTPACGYLGYNSIRSTSDRNKG